MRRLPRIPAHLELRPKKPVWHKVQPELGFRLKQWTKFSGEVYRMESGVSAPYGYYKIVKNQGSGYFIKILSAETETQQSESDRMARWLREEGVETSCIIAGFPKRVSNLNLNLNSNSDYLILAYNNINGHFVKKNINELALIGNALGNLHTVIKKCEWSSSVKKSGFKRHETLVNRLINIKNGKTFHGIPAGAHNLLCHVEKDILSVLIDDPQVIHGDLNYGNILINENTADVVFLDFEDSWCAWFSPLMDVAFVIERFALVNSENESLELSKAFSKAYFSTANFNFNYDEQLSDILRAISVRAMLLLSFIVERDVQKVYNNEWKKFFDLYHQTFTKADLLKSIVNES